MADHVRPSEEEFTRILQESHALWSAYSNAADTSPSLSYSCINPGPLIRNTPSFLGCDMIRENDQISLNCVEKSGHSLSDLFLKGYSSWKTSTGVFCNLEPITIDSQSLLAIHRPLQVQFSDDAPLSIWPGVEGLPELGEGNYIAVLFLAWNYIFSAKWAELLSKSPEHECQICLAQTSESAAAPLQDQDIKVDIGSEISEDEAHWWDVILSTNRNWKITTDYKGKTYFAPWSVSVVSQGSVTTGRQVTENDTASPRNPPSSDTAFLYLSRFCAYNGLYGQCLAALSAALFTLFPNREPVLLPIPRHLVDPGVQQSFLPDSHYYMIMEHKVHLPRYMTLSCNVWGIRSLLHSSFYDADIECNLVSPWLDPAFAMIDPLISQRHYCKLANVLAYRQPRLAPLWIGAILMGVAKSTLTEIRIGMNAINLPAAAWTGTVRSFITAKPSYDASGSGKSIRREDECRLLFISGCDGWARVPLAPWKPFGEIELCDTEIEVHRHAQCGEKHFLEYQYWNWGHMNGKELNETSLNLGYLNKDSNPVIGQQPISHATSSEVFLLDPVSESLSELATRGIFEWLRSRGYPACEKPIYEHPWICLEDSSEDNDNDLVVNRDSGLGSDALLTVSESKTIENGLNFCECHQMLTQ